MSNLHVFSVMVVPRGSKATSHLLNAFLLYSGMRMVEGTAPLNGNGNGAPSNGRPPSSTPTTPVSSDVHDILESFTRGNILYTSGTNEERNGDSSVRGHKRNLVTATLDQLMDPPLDPPPRQAVIISCASTVATVEEILNTSRAGLVDVIRVSGCVCGDRQYDGVIGSVEYALKQAKPPPLLLVLGHAHNLVIEDAVRCALSNSPDPKMMQSPIVQAIMPAARDAVLQDPYGSFDDLCQIAAKLNVWNTVERLLTKSKTVYDKVTDGSLEVHGAFCDDTGKVHFMGQHPNQNQLLATRPVIVRTAKDPPVPAEEALSILFAGNRRYKKGNSVHSKYLGVERNKRLTEGGQLPYAVIIGCADSRAPPEVLFDARPGNLFVLRVAGNTWGTKAGAGLGSAEYAIGHLQSKLVVVMAHTKCGAMTAAVEAVKANQDLKDVPGSIGLVLKNLWDDAVEAVRAHPQASTAEQVAHATKLSVFSTMEKTIRNSPIIADGIRTMDVQVQGAVYDIETGGVEWLGPHPDLANILQHRMLIHKWKQGPYIRPQGEPDSYLAYQEIERLREGNFRFMNRRSQREPSDKPYAFLLVGSELKVPIEDIFDTGTGALVVQRSMGNIIGHRENMLFHSLEYQLQRFMPRLLLVLGNRDSCVLSSTIDHLEGLTTSFGPTHIIHEAVGASALKALLQTKAGGSVRVETSGGVDMNRRRLTAELNSFYTVEQLLRGSETIRNAVKERRLEIHVAILREDTGKVDFIGMHPMQDQLLKDDDDDEEWEGEPEVKPQSVVQAHQEVKPQSVLQVDQEVTPILTDSANAEVKPLLTDSAKKHGREEGRYEVKPRLTDSAKKVALGALLVSEVRPKLLDTAHKVSPALKRFSALLVSEVKPKLLGAAHKVSPALDHFSAILVTRMSRCLAALDGSKAELRTVK